MKQLLVSALGAVVLVTAAQAQSVRSTPDLRYSPRTAFSVFGLYSNDSSHMILGQEQNRKIAGLGVAYSRRLKASRFAEWTWDAEVRPLNFVRDPVVSDVSTVVVSGAPTGIVNLPPNGPFEGPTQLDCTSGTFIIDDITPGAGYTQTIVQQCGSRWTYAGGISPLGQRVSFAKLHRVQPYLVANAGFLVAPRDIPVNNSARFNFTFEGGGGVEWFRDHRRSVALDFRVQHLSNAYRGYYNPGIDSGIFRVTYRIGR